MKIQTVQDIIMNIITNELKAIPQTSFEQCFKKCKKKRRERCIAANGSYFIGDKVTKL
jgi:hypothetical protein